MYTLGVVVVDGTTVIVQFHTKPNKCYGSVHNIQLP